MCPAFYILFSTLRTGGTLKPQEIFDVCIGRYRGLRSRLGDKVSAVDLKRPSSGYAWRPEGARGAEYIADFESAAGRALRRPEWKGRRKLFRIYFLRGVDYKRAIRLVGISEGSFDYTAKEVKKAVGRECARAGLFPPSHYFRVRGK